MIRNKILLKRVMDPEEIRSPTEGESFSENEYRKVLREELRCKIMLNRVQRGEPELPNNEEKISVKRELSEEECERKLRRQEQNRRAAKKCRNKKKEQHTALEEEFAREKSRNDELQLKISELLKELNQLKQALAEHRCFSKTPEPVQRRAATPLFPMETPCTISSKTDMMLNPLPTNPANFPVPEMMRSCKRFLNMETACREEEEQMEFDMTQGYSTDVPFAGWDRSHQLTSPSLYPAPTFNFDKGCEDADDTQVDFQSSQSGPVMFSSQESCPEVSEGDINEFAALLDNENSIYLNSGDLNSLIGLRH